MDIPLKAKKLIAKSFKYHSINNTKETATAMAMKDFERAFKKVPSGYIQKQDVSIKTAVTKSGFFSPSYYFNGVLSSDSFDGMHKISATLLKWLDDNNKVSYQGDADHLTYRTGNVKYKGLFKLVDKSFDAGKLFIKFVIDKGHNSYKEFIKNKDDYRGLSAEFYDPVYKGNMIIGASGIGWTLTDDPANEEAQITSKE